MRLKTPEARPRRPRKAQVFTHGVLLALAALTVTLCTGCSKLDTSTQPPPVTCNASDPNTPCCGSLAIGYGLVNGFTPIGTDTTLDLACWNMLNFPTAGETSVAMAVQIIGGLNLDVWGVEEIADTTAFRDLVARLPGYAGVYSPDGYGSSYQKTGIIYRTAAITLNSWKQILTGDSYAFTRPPIEADLTAHGNGRTYHFRFVVQHLKAYADAASLARRRSADQKLHAYLESQRAADPTLPYVVVGDWNGRLNDPAISQSFPVLLADSSDYKFLDLCMASLNYYQSYPSTGIIDHILVNKAACAPFSRGQVVTLRPGDYLPDYSQYMSDHRPVMVSAPVFR
jgi:hypothetical protein